MYIIFPSWGQILPFSDKQEIPNYCFIVWDGKNIPILFSESKIQQMIERSEQSHIIIHGDVIMSAFYFLSCWQENVSDATDEIGRFPFKESFLSKSGLICTPVVNYYFDILVKAIESVPGMNVSMNPKHTHGLKIGITHDIDQCKTGSLQDGYRQVRGGEWWNVPQEISEHLDQQEMFDDYMKFARENDIQLHEPFDSRRFGNTVMQNYKSKPKKKAGELARHYFCFKLPN